ncbi:MAG: hypothetical protein LBU03_03005 [Tannerellaceae bacterium]|jgi:hypothetical protein|nr:hypothetical protein [Tannerellaceae bacterium]
MTKKFFHLDRMSLFIYLLGTVALASCEALGLDDDGYDEAMADVRARTADKEKERDGYLEMKALYEDSAKYYTGLIGTESTAGEHDRTVLLAHYYYPRWASLYEYKAQIAAWERSKLITEGWVVGNEYEGATLFAIQNRFDWEWGEWNEESPDLEVLVWGEETCIEYYQENLQNDRWYDEITSSNMWDVSSAIHYWTDMYGHLDPSHPSAKYPYSAYIMETGLYYSQKVRAIQDEVSRRRKEVKAFLVEWRKEKEEARKKMSEEIKVLEANGAKWGD